MTAALVPAAPLTRRERLRAPLLTIAGLSATTLALHLRDPHQQGTWGFCPLRLLTGVACPGCGGLRAVNDLTNGDLGAAASSNLLVTVGIPVAVVVLVAWVPRSWRGTPARRLSPRATRVLWSLLAVVAAAFTVLRNTPAGAWLAP